MTAGRRGTSRRALHGVGAPAATTPATRLRHLSGEVWEQLADAAGSEPGAKAMRQPDPSGWSPLAHLIAAERALVRASRVLEAEIGQEGLRYGAAPASDSTTADTGSGEHATAPGGKPPQAQAATGPPEPGPPPTPAVPAPAVPAQLPPPQIAPEPPPLLQLIWLCRAAERLATLIDNIPEIGEEPRSPTPGGHADRTTRAARTRPALVDGDMPPSGERRSHPRRRPSARSGTDRVHPGSEPADTGEAMPAHARQHSSAPSPGTPVDRTAPERHVPERTVDTTDLTAAGGIDPWVADAEHHVHSALEGLGRPLASSHR